VLNDAGGAFFGALLRGPGVTTANQIALFAGPYDDLRLIARQGDPAPGMPTGVSFNSPMGNQFTAATAFNDAHQVASVMHLTGPGVTEANDGALYLFDPTLGPVLIAREGTPFDIGGGIFRTIADFGIHFTGERSDDKMNGLNDLGVLAFTLRFTDGSSGVFTATVPEPAGPLAAAAIVAAASLRRRRSRR
jgi:MYXO-CTERM domain-containing protein